MKNRLLFPKKAIAATVGLATANTAFPKDILEEVVVTATRRAESVQDVPYNISAVAGSELKISGITDIGTLVRNIPGIAYTDRGARSGAFNSGIAMRGISVEDGRLSSPLNTAPAVSTYLGETPLFVNFHLTDLERVEVLRGPQGTLYGSGSLGGTLRFIPNKPSFDGNELEISGSLAKTANSERADDEIDLLANVSVSDSFAIRANIGRSYQAGWIDQANAVQRDGAGAAALQNPADFLNSPAARQRIEGTNDERSVYGRVSARWKPNDWFEAQLSYQKQQDDSDGIPQQAAGDLGLSEYESAALLEEPFESDVDLLSFDTETDLGFATLTTSISRYESEQRSISDSTGLYEAFAFYGYSYGAMPRSLIEDTSINNDEATVAELRLVSNSDGVFNWVAGVFYQDQDTTISNEQFFYGYADWADACFEAGRIDCGLGTTTGEFSLLFPPGEHPSADAAGLAVVQDQNFISQATANFKDIAIFGELSWYVTDTWQLTFGFRRFDQEFDNEQVNAAFFVDTASRSRQTAKEEDTLFKVNTSWDINDQTMVYATWSEGFRRGGANALPTFVTTFDEFGNGTDVPTNPALFSYAPDRITNVELGVKGYITEAVQYTLAVYDIEWEDVQLDTLVTPFQLTAVVNTGTAESRGVELEMNAALSDNLEFGLGYSYVDASLESPDPVGAAEAGLDVDALRGVDLPGVSKNTVSVNLKYYQSLSEGRDLIYGLNGQYRDGYRSRLDPALSNSNDSYQIWDGFIALEMDKTTVRLFVNNLFDEIGVINTQNVNVFGPRRGQLVTRPRSIGLGASYRF